MWANVASRAVSIGPAACTLWRRRWSALVVSLVVALTLQSTAFAGGPDFRDRQGDAPRSVTASGGRDGCAKRGKQRPRPRAKAHAKAKSRPKHRAKARAKPKRPGTARSHGKRRPLTKAACRPRTARALFRDSVATMAQRYFLTAEQFRRINGMSAEQRLVHRRSYLVARGDVGEHLDGGVSMGPSTAAYVVVNPQRAFGQPRVVALLQGAATEVQRAFPEGHRIVFEDLSLPNGGCMRPHIEHRGGREVDAGLYHRDVQELRHLRRATATSLDAVRTWRFLGTLIASGCVDRVLLDGKLHAPLAAEARRRGASPGLLAATFSGFGRGRALIRHAAGHDNHAHIRFRVRCTAALVKGTVPVDAGGGDAGDRGAGERDADERGAGDDAPSANRPGTKHGDATGGRDATQTPTLGPMLLPHMPPRW
jgi:hypothetical protein